MLGLLFLRIRSVDHLALFLSEGEGEGLLFRVGGLDYLFPFPQ